MSFKDYCKQLESKIASTYEEGVTLEQAEKLAAEFLYAQMKVSAELAKEDLDARMRKSGVKAIRAAVYGDICSKAEKKPTVDALEHMVNSDQVVLAEQKMLDTAEVSRDELTRIYNVCREAHIYYRGVSKGRFE